MKNTFLKFNQYLYHHEIHKKWFFIKKLFVFFECFVVDKSLCFFKGSLVCNFKKVALVVLVATQLSVCVDAAKKKRKKKGKKAVVAEVVSAQPVVTKATIKQSIQNLINSYGNNYSQGKSLLAELENLGNDGAALNAFARKALVDNNPLLKNKSIVFVERKQYPRDHHNTGTIFQKGEVNQGSFNRAKGGALKVVSLKDGSVRTLLETPQGLVRDPELNFDGTTVLFSYRKDFNDDYHIYEINTDGSNLKQLTALKGVSDLDPFYFSDGKIGFSSTREPKFCACNRHIMANLFKMEADGANIVQIGKSIEYEGHGVQMPDGRILYNRWEYTDRNFGGGQGLWTSNPDGTNHALYMWQSTPHPLLNARPIPDSNQILAVVSSCHDRPWGALVIVDRSKGIEGKEPVVKIWPADSMKRIADKSKNYAGSGGIDNFRNISVKYEDPLPLSKDFFLVSRTIGKVSSEKVGIFLVDRFGNEIPVHNSKQAGMGCFDPMLIKSYAKPAALADKVNYSKTTGTFLVMNVYEGTHMKGVKPGSVKYLRVVDNPPKMNWTKSAYGGQGTQSPAMNFHDFDNKRVLGTVPVEADGSVQFTAPIDKFVYFQLLDENGKMIQSMRSGIIAQPGENNACIGCHDDRDNAPPRPSGKLAALQKAPFNITEATADTKGNFSFQAEVQPIFDKHCVSCHDYGKKGEKKLVLAGDRTSMFSVSYLELHSKKMIAPIGGGANKIYNAYEWGSHKSELIKTLEKKHHDVKLSDSELKTIITWVDLNAPYYPDYSSVYSSNPGGRSPLTAKDHKEIEKLTKLEKLDKYSHRQAWLFNFKRPELSPILAKVKNADTKAKVIEIIKRGSKRLETTPRNDMPGYVPSKEDQRRLKRYEELFQRELANRRAIQSGKKSYDPGIKRD